jgi:prepilin-type processing-associated H-X9-DG protein
VDADDRFHWGGTNVLFCDGHVQWFQTDDLIVHDTYSVVRGLPPSTFRDQQVARMWNRDNRP